jgi:hypothetical protein
MQIPVHNRRGIAFGIPDLDVDVLSYVIEDGVVVLK